MSLFTALGLAYGGYGQGRQQRFEDTLEQQQADERKQELAEQIKMDEQNAQLTQQQVIGQRNINEQYARSREFESKLKLPPNWGSMAPDQKLNYLQQTYHAALAAGDTDTAKAALDEQGTIELGAERLANAQYTLQGKLPLAQAQAQAARTAHQTAIQIAAGHDATQWKIATARIAGSAALAQYNYGARYNIAELAGAIRFQVANDQIAANEAKAIYDGQVKEFISGQNSVQALTDPNYVAPAEPGYPSVPPITQNFNLGPPPPVPGGNNTQQPAVKKISANQALTIAGNELRSGQPKAKISQQLDQAVQAGAISAQEASQIKVMLHLNVSAQAPVNPLLPR